MGTTTTSPATMRLRNWRRDASQPRARGSCFEKLFMSGISCISYRLNVEQCTADMTTTSTTWARQGNNAILTGASMQG
jgi:hypothetical protein